MLMLFYLSLVHTQFTNSITNHVYDWQPERQLVSNLLLMKADEF